MRKPNIDSLWRMGRPETQRSGWTNKWEDQRNSGKSRRKKTEWWANPRIVRYYKKSRWV